MTVEVQHWGETLSTKFLSGSSHSTLWLRLIYKVSKVSFSEHSWGLPTEILKFLLHLKLFFFLIYIQSQTISFLELERITQEAVFFRLSPRVL